jgi:hypothetical protein
MSVTLFFLEKAVFQKIDKPYINLIKFNSYNHIYNKEYYTVKYSSSKNIINHTMQYFSYRIKGSKYG